MSLKLNLIALAWKPFSNIIPQNSEFIYQIGKRYVDQYNGENNCDNNTNGGLFF